MFYLLSMFLQKSKHFNQFWYFRVIRCIPLHSVNKILNFQALMILFAEPDRYSNTGKSYKDTNKPISEFFSILGLFLELPIGLC